MAVLKWCVFSALVVWASVGHAENKTVTLTSESGQLVLQSVLAGLDGTDIDIAAMKSMGYGPVLPMACETTDIGKQINRRVEIWARASQ